MKRTRKINKDEYLFLREEALKRIGWYMDYGKYAIMVTMTFWSICLTAFMYSKNWEDKSEHAKILLNVLIQSAPIILFILLIFLYLVSCKNYENILKIYSISSYLQCFYEKPICENKNGAFFSWETSHAHLCEYLFSFDRRPSEITPDQEKYSPRLFLTVSISNCELIILAFLSWLSMAILTIIYFCYYWELAWFMPVLFVVFCLLGLAIIFEIVKCSFYPILINEVFYTVLKYWNPSTKRPPVSLEKIKDLIIESKSPIFLVLVPFLLIFIISRKTLRRILSIFSSKKTP